MVWNYIILWAVTSLISYLLAPKPQTEPPAGLDEVKIPSVEEGKEIPVIFGCIEIAPFVVWYGDFSTKAIEADASKK